MKGCLTFCIIYFSFIIISSLLLETINYLSITFNAWSYWVTLCLAKINNKIPRKTLEKPPSPIICKIVKLLMLVLLFAINWAN